MEHETETILTTYRGYQIWTLFDDDGVSLWGFDVHAPESVDEPTADPLGTCQTLADARLFIDHEIRLRRWDDAAGLND